MRLRLRQIFVIGLALSLLGIGVPAWSQDDPSRSCNDELAAGTPSYVVCRWMATPEEAADIAKFWLENDGQHMIEAGPQPPITIDCSEEGNVCPTDSEGDGQMHDVGSPDVPGAEDGGTPECQNGDECGYVDPTGVTAAEKAAAQQSTAGQAAKAVTQTTMRLWIETELADEYKAGKLAEGVKKVAALVAAQPEVVGVRFTSQLGYNQTFATAEELDKFVAETTAALRTALPGKKLAAHTVVPQLGCGTNDTCKAELAKKYPLLDPDRIGTWLAKGMIDQLALDNGHLATEYATWNIDAATAQRNQWIQVRARAWDAYAQIAAEDASFAASGSSQLTEEQATQAITERIAAPLQDDAAETVTLWTRWQNDQGQVSRVYGEKWAANTTWDQLKKLGSVRARLATIYDPANPEVDVATDLKNLSEVFGQVYLHAA
ncbi:hypothetical protein FH608_029805 [Nonomuraea phyllanthi]|uniref:Uncharacterized protein n=1 Tax=Nonomuraea phyllanthi TaxID=2219224 RepID=A0A5C4W415_9ACTN|nr:hypothetical protein [Nonomuraea phyllanthi]KAB8191457.1 hypothetical protein FH608_029805 [Nonomuraea phyllanthi]QFY13216.1 hypothetical protein GBF35_47545 [Nonomuraea phyllanthi]